MTDKPKNAEIIWNGAVGISNQPQKNKDGNYFWKFEFTRRVKIGDDWKYFDSFTDRDVEKLGKAMSEAISFREQTDPLKWLEEQVAKQAA